MQILGLPWGNTLAYLVRVIESEKGFTRLKENLNVGTFSIHVQLKYHFSDQILHLDQTYKTFLKWNSRFLHCHCLQSVQ